jgi:hypothetical protein
MTASVRAPEAAAAEADTLDRGPSHRGFAHDAARADVGLGRLELRLHEQHEVGADRGEGHQLGHEARERDERQIGDDERGRERQILPSEVATFVRSAHDHAGVVAQRPGELPVADVHGHDPRRPRLQQAVGEPPGGRAGVEGLAASRVDVEPLEGWPPASRRRETRSGRPAGRGGRRRRVPRGRRRWSPDRRRR